MAIVFRLQCNNCRISTADKSQSVICHVKHTFSSLMLLFFYWQHTRRWKCGISAFIWRKVEFRPFQDQDFPILSTFSVWRFLDPIIRPRPILYLLSFRYFIDTSYSSDFRSLTFKQFHVRFCHSVSLNLHVLRSPYMKYFRPVVGADLWLPYLAFIHTLLSSIANAILFSKLSNTQILSRLL